MDVIADLHLHSCYSQATSKDLNIPNLEKYARLKGVGLLGTGDFTHPIWNKELKQQLTEDGSGILRTVSGFPFLLTTELSFVYTQGGKGRRIHLLTFAPSFSVVDQIIDVMGKKGRLDYDGRPIFNMSCVAYVEKMKAIDEKVEVIPAHIWTPWFGALGSKSGFDSLQECFQDQTKHIHAFETGLSSDPPMNWRLSNLDKFTQVSFSDLHSFWPWRMGREATVFEIKQLSFNNIMKGIRTKEGLKETIEVDPNFGKYHFTGHRNCNICLKPSDALGVNNICPSCKKELTIGVLQRVEELADRPEGYQPKQPIPFRSLIPLSEIIATAMGKKVEHKLVWNEFNKTVGERSEFDVMLHMEEDELRKQYDEKIVKIILENREGKLKISPGYDGEYGKVLLEGEQPRVTMIEKQITAKKKPAQRSLTDF
ncbi:DNA helicase UvrD [Candidatus Woesearchaeota archaeon]|nr:DNA helicase UvrD [Candidatus Woesearchaeota archaeon]